MTVGTAADASPTADAATSAAAAARVRRLLWGFRETCLLVAAIELGLVARLAAAPAEMDDLARALAAEPQALRRLLRALASLDLVEIHGGGEAGDASDTPGDRVALTAAGRALSDLGDFAHLIGEEYLPAWARIAHSVRTGGTAFEHVFGMSVWKHREGRPDLDAALNGTMLAYQRSQLAAILGAYDFSAARRLVDVGGSHGALVAGILASYPALEAVLFDQPHVIAGAAAHLAAAGPAVAARCRTEGGSFFESVPRGGDVYILKHILHNWDDAASTRILRVCREAMTEASALLVIENVMPDRGSGGVRDGHWDAFVLDMHMLAVLGGRVRTGSEHDALLAAAGLVRARTLDAAGLVDVIEARPRTP